MGEKLPLSSKSRAKTRHAEIFSASRDDGILKHIRQAQCKQVQDDDGLIKKLLHFFTLLTLKEGYLTCRNCLGLLFHPFKTIKVMRQEKDSVQTLLIFGLPFYFWLGGVGMVLVARYLIGIHLFPMGFLAKTLLFLTSFLAGLIFSYLGYWSFVWWRKR